MCVVEVHVTVFCPQEEGIAQTLIRERVAHAPSYPTELGRVDYSAIREKIKEVAEATTDRTIQQLSDHEAYTDVRRGSGMDDPRDALQKGDGRARPSE